MIPGNIPLAFSTILVRRFIDSYAGTLPVAVTSSALPVPLTAVVLSGALMGLYHQLRKGTLVGVGRKVPNFIRSSCHTIQRRIPVNSWFLRNAQACRRKCTEAMHRLARQSSESLEEIQRGVLPEVNSMPDFRNISTAERDALARHVKEPPVLDLFNKEMSEKTVSPTRQEEIEPKSRWRSSKRILTKPSTDEISNNDAGFCVDLTREDPIEPKNRWRASQRPRAVTYGPVSHRPVTRHFFRRNLVSDDRADDSGNRSTRTISKNRKTSLSLPRITKTTVEIPVVIRTEPEYYKDFGRPQTRRSSRPISNQSRTITNQPRTFTNQSRIISNQLRTISNYKNHSRERSDEKLTRRKSEKIALPKLFHKVTRKTRSGRVYAYRV